MKICGIYKITSPTERVYIGQSVDIHHRWRSYINLSKSMFGQRVLYNSFKKYGGENHTFEIIEECDVKDLNCRERYWQDYYNVLEEGMNCVLQECGEKRRVESVYTKEKRSHNLTGKNNPMHGKLGELHPNYGKSLSEEQKKHLSENMKGRFKGELNPFYGQKHSMEAIDRMSELAKKRVGNKNPFYNKTHTDDTKRLLSDKAKKRYKDPEYRRKCSEARSKGVYYTPLGQFTSTREAATVHGLSKSAILSWCTKKVDKKVGFNYQVPEEYRGDHTWRECGFYFIPNED